MQLDIARFDPEGNHLFQFPFPRDSFCNTKWKIALEAKKTEVSVPFSSGFLLQPEYFTTRPFCRSCFSSLFLGIPFATGPAWTAAIEEAMVSVPFSSGFLLQPPKGTCFGFRFSGFSSLFLGIPFATAPRAVTYCFSP